MISQFEGIPLESLILDEIISQEEYDKLKHFSLVNEGVKCLNALNTRDISEQELYCTRVQLMHCMLLFINRLMNIFDFISKKIEYENEWITNHLTDIYYNEVYVFSDKYAEEQYERAEYYAEHPELLEEIEENEADKLHRKVNEAIWAGDTKTIIECFPQIDKDNKQIQSELTWNVAKNVMKNKKLRKLYYEKYGIKYKMRREKRKKR